MKAFPQAFFKKLMELKGNTFGRHPQMATKATRLGWRSLFEKRDAKTFNSGEKPLFYF